MRRCAILLLSIIVATPVFAAEPTPSELAAGREQFRVGVTAAKDGRWEAARDAFARAFDLAKKPSILLNLAGAYSKTTQPVEAAETYRQFLREAPADLLRASRKKVERLLAQIDARTPRLSIALAEPAGGDVVYLDGRALSTSALDLPLPVNPGTHQLARRRGGAVVSERMITLTEGQRETVTLPAGSPAVVALDPPRGPPPTTVAPPIVEAPRPEGDGGSGATWWIVGGVVVVAVAAVVVGVTIASSSDVDTTYGGTTNVVVQTLR